MNKSEGLKSSTREIAQVTLAASKTKNRELTENKRRKIKERQEWGQQATDPKAKAELIQRLFQSFDTDKNGSISFDELQKGLLSWGVKINRTNRSVLLKSFPFAQNSNPEQFASIMEFFIFIRQGFTKYDIDNSNTISRTELAEFMKDFDYKFNSDFIMKILNIYDVNQDGELDWQEMVSLMLYLNYLDVLFKAEDKDKSGNLDPSELQSILRTLDIHLTVKETNIFLKRVPKTETNEKGQVNLSNFIQLLHDIKENISEVRKENRIRRDQKRAVIDIKAPVSWTDTIHFQTKLQKQRKIAEELQKEYQNKKMKYEDPGFPATPEACFPTKMEQRKVIHEWRRISDCGGITSVIKNGIEEGDIRPGWVHFWLLSALSIMSTYGTSILSDLFVSLFPDEGIIQCRFWKNGDWEFVITDDRLPYDIEGYPCFGACHDPTELWVAILEKCYAKLHGSYEAIENGSISEALADFTGTSSETMEVKKEFQCFQAIIQNLEDNNLVGCVAKSNAQNEERKAEVTADGILLLHAYTILSAIEVQDFKLLKIRNPWGVYEWNGRWSDGSQEWTPELHKELNYEFSDDGEFWMEFSDFCGIFSKIHFLKIHAKLPQKWHRQLMTGEWTPKTSGGSLGSSNWSCNPQYHFKATNDSRVFVTLKQEDLRYKLHQKSQYESIGVAVLIKGDGNSTKKTELNGKNDIVAMSPFQNTRDVCLEWTALKGIDYVIVPSYFESGKTGKFWVSLLSYPQTSILLDTYIPAPVNSIGGSTDSGVAPLSVRSYWTYLTAGGSPQYTTWIYSPQFLLNIPQRDQVEISVRLLSDPNQKLPLFGFFVLYAEPHRKQVFNLGSILYSSKFADTLSNTATVPLEAGWYNIMCSTLEPGIEMAFELSVKGTLNDTKVLDDLQSLNNWKIVSLPGHWDSSSGCSTFKEDWMQNPVFRLEVYEKSSFQIVLDSDKVNSAVGYYIFTTKDGIFPLQIQGKSTFTKSRLGNRDLASQYWSLDRATYLLVPTTFERRERANFYLTIYTEKEGYVKLIPIAYNYLPRQYSY
jgi:Ca2+-binding EF-hand superfamily protein